MVEDNSKDTRIPHNLVELISAHGRCLIDLSRVAGIIVNNELNSVSVMIDSGELFSLHVTKSGRVRIANYADTHHVENADEAYRYMISLWTDWMKKN